jgi:hypothetical protein
MVRRQSPGKEAGCVIFRFLELAYKFAWLALAAVLLWIAWPVWSAVFRLLANLLGV